MPFGFESGLTMPWTNDREKAGIWITGKSCDCLDMPTIKYSEEHIKRVGIGTRS